MSTSALFLDLLIHPEANRTWSPCYSAISSSLTQTPIAGRNAAHTKPGDQTLSRDRTGLLRQFPAGIYKIVHQLQESLAFDAQRSTFNVRVVAAPYNRCLQIHRPVVPFLSFLATPANCGHISRHRRKFLEESRFHRTLSMWILPRSAGASRSWRRLRVWPKKAHHTD